MQCIGDDQYPRAIQQYCNPLQDVTLSHVVHQHLLPLILVHQHLRISQVIGGQIFLQVSIGTEKVLLENRGNQTIFSSIGAEIVGGGVTR